MAVRGLTRIDGHVATRLRAARNLAQLTQDEASKHLGVSFQQMQKYENGTNRITVGKLALLAKTYGVGFEWFFEGAPDLNGKKKTTTDWGTELTRLPYGAEIAEALCNLSRERRAMLLNIAREMA